MNEKSYAVVLTGGYSPEDDIIIEYTNRAEYIVAADSGFDIALKNGIQVDYVLGDMDSVKSREALEKVPQKHKHVVSHEKDETDTELALMKAWEQGYRNIVLIGGGGGRLDHIIGILHLFERKIHPSIWITDKETVVLITKHFENRSEIGQRVSIFPVSDTFEGLASAGLKWSLGGLEWKRGDMGISNETVDTNFSVSLEKGALLLIMKNRRDIIYV